MDKLTFIIRELLHKEEKVFLPGLGVLTMQRKGAELDTGASEVHPPRDEVDFLASSHIQFDHFEKQLDRLEFPSSVDLAGLKKELQHQLNDIAESSEGQIGSWLGLEKIDGGDFSVRFLDDSKITPINQLPVLSVPRPKVMDSMAEGVAVAASTQDDKEKKRASWVLPALLTALVLLLSFVVWWYTPDWRAADDAFTRLLVKEERVNVSPSQIVEEAKPKSKEESPFKEMEKTPLLHADNRSSVDSSTTNIPEETKESPSSEKSEEYKSEVSEFPANDCVIVVGSFSKSSNVSRMRERLQTQGHKVFTQNINGLTRVGLYTTCAPDPLDSVLSETRKNIEEAAWLLEE